MSEKGKSSIDNKKAVNLIVQRNITKLFKSLLDVADDIKQSNTSMLLKVSRETSDKYVQDINYLTPEAMDHIRKKVLDLGNEAIREISSVLECFDLKVDENKLENLLRSKQNKKSRTVVMHQPGHMIKEEDDGK
jgi:hypothetical protein